MVKTFTVDTNPKVVQWAVSTAGWEKKELVKALGIRENVYDGWLDGSIKPTIKQLEKLASKTKRPIASFFLTEQPQEEPKPKDYRMLPDKEGEFEKKTIFAIRKSRYLQEISNELSLNINVNLSLKLKKVTLSDRAEEIAQLYREMLNLSIEKQEAFGSKPYAIYDHLRNALEDFNIFSFQISMPLNDARGFALADKTPKVIVVNSADEIKPRIFTLVHELAHILLGETSIDIPNFDAQDDIEKWCNSFAASFLMPKEILAKVYRDNKDNIRSGLILNKISNKYNVSKSMFVYNLSKHDYISKQDYQNFRDAISNVETKKTSAGGGGVPQDQKCLSMFGKKFVSLVADNIEKEQITTNDALSYLSIKSRNLDKVISRAGK